jgi:hypothetical protein
VGIFWLAALRRRFLPRQVDREIGKIRAMYCQSAVPVTFASLRGRPACLASMLAKLLCLSNKGGYAADAEYPMQMTPYLKRLAGSHGSVGLVSPRPGDRNSSNMDTRVPSASKLAKC